MRLTVSDANDNQLEALQDGLDEVYDAHYPHEPGDRCTECGQRSPCRTVTIISRQRSKIQELACPTEEGSATP